VVAAAVGRDRDIVIRGSTQRRRSAVELARGNYKENQKRPGEIFHRDAFILGGSDVRWPDAHAFHVVIY